MNGYAGKILRVNLTHRKIKTIPTRDYEDWVGGHGMGSAIFFDLVKDKTVDGFDPANVVTIMTSPLCGTLVPAGSGRTEVVQAMEAEEFVQVVYRVSMEIKKIITWYKDKMLKKGWKVVMEMNMENNCVLNLAKDNSTLVVNAWVDQDGQTTVHLVLEEK